MVGIAEAGNMISYRLDHAARRTGKPVDPVGFWSRIATAIPARLPDGPVTRSGSAHSRSSPNLRLSGDLRNREGFAEGLP